MNTNEIKELIHLIDQSSLKYFELENASISLKLSKRDSDHRVSTHENVKDEQNHSIQEVARPAESVKQTSESSVSSTSATDTDTAPVADDSLHTIKSPIVGTSYRSSSPDSPVFVEIGDTVEVGQTVLIIEAMKVMNEIKSDVSGVIEEILVEDGQAIEYDHALIKIKVN